MTQLPFVVLLCAASTQAYYGSGGASSGRGGQLLDVRQLADNMALDFERGGGGGGGFSGSSGGSLFLGGGGGDDDGGAIFNSGGGGFSGLSNGGDAFSSFGGNGGGGFSGGNIDNIAVQRAPARVDVLPVQSDGPAEPTNILVDSHSSPVNLIVRSFSQAVNLDVQHIPSKGTFRQTESQDEPSHHRHRIIKPVIQELHEVITPIRRVVQQILPVQEDIETKVPRAVNAVPVVAAPAAPLLRAPVPLLGGFVPIRSSRGGCSRRGGCGRSRKLAGTVVPSFGHSLGGAYKS